eukprot:3315928-Alexandrium_andersonii.AAC.1
MGTGAQPNVEPLLHKIPHSTVAAHAHPGDLALRPKRAQKAGSPRRAHTQAASSCSSVRLSNQTLGAAARPDCT